MKTSSIFPSTYLKAEDFNKPRTVTIKDIEIEKFDEGSKPIASFEELPKQLVLNKTNMRAIEKFLDSDETDDWIGKQITLVSAWVDFKGEQVKAIRIRPATPGTAITDNDIPF